MPPPGRFKSFRTRLDKRKRRKLFSKIQGYSHVLGHEMARMKALDLKDARAVLFELKQTKGDVEAQYPIFFHPVIRPSTAAFTDMLEAGIRGESIDHTNIADAARLFRPVFFKHYTVMGLNDPHTPRIYHRSVLNLVSFGLSSGALKPKDVPDFADGLGRIAEEADKICQRAEYDPADRLLPSLYRGIEDRKITPANLKRYIEHMDSVGPDAAPAMYGIIASEGEVDLDEVIRVQREFLEHDHVPTPGLMRHYIKNFREGKEK